MRPGIDVARLARSTQRCPLAAVLIVAPKTSPDTKAGRVPTGMPSRRKCRREASWQAANAFACILRAILIRGIPLCDRFHSRIIRRLQTCKRGLKGRKQPD